VTADRLAVDAGYSTSPPPAEVEGVSNVLSNKNEPSELKAYQSRESHQHPRHHDEELGRRCRCN
jgi:hypothetical protein